MKFFLMSLLVSITLNSMSQELVLRKYVGNLKQVTVDIEGQSCEMLFDTGGGETLISPEIASRLGKVVYGSTTSFRMSGEKIRYAKCDSITLYLGGKRVFHETVGVWDVMKVLPEGLPKIDGVLSLKSFKDYIVSIDLAGERVILETESSFKRARKHLTPLSARFATGMDGNELTVLVNIPENGRSYWFLFDSGNLSNLLLAHSTASNWHLQSDTVTRSHEYEDFTVELGKRKIVTHATSEHIIYDGALNYEILSQLRFVIDFPRRQVWVY